MALGLQKKERLSTLWCIALATSKPGRLQVNKHTLMHILNWMLWSLSLLNPNFSSLHDSLVRVAWSNLKQLCSHHHSLCASFIPSSDAAALTASLFVFSVKQTFHIFVRVFFQYVLCVTKFPTDSAGVCCGVCPPTRDSL